MKPEQRRENKQWGRVYSEGEAKGFQYKRKTEEDSNYGGKETWPKEISYYLA